MADKFDDSSIHEKRRQARLVRRIVLVVITALTALIVIAGISVYIYITSALEPIERDSDSEKRVEIPIGSSAGTIGKILEKEGLIKNAFIFRYYTRYKNESGFQAGVYELSPSMSTDELISQLKEGTMEAEPSLRFTIPEGKWFEDIVEIIAEETSYDKEEIVDELDDEDFLEKVIDNYSIITDDILDEDIRYPLEGYLFPARYDFYEEEPSIQEIAVKMIERTEANVVEFSEQIEAGEYNVHEVLTIASIVEREAQQAEDRPIIAGVLYNRLEQDMKLEVDPSVAYAIEEHVYMTSYEDLESESPYNTYRYEGLPPGPIASPGQGALKAALEPENNDYLFFYARPNGEVIYNVDYNEHNEVQEKYREEWEEAQESE
ncbi:endolytic transglycosylase MltG [Alteribacillus sp. HJP-4]|uniref:endolytic transglycosylase MltG n=1 Tax=Alteribacillus sp. HJP-4 TaxID=2775394 RepID=UPI0035CCF87F